MVCEQLSPSHSSSKGSSLRKLTYNEGQGPQDTQMERGGRAQGGVEGEDHYPAWRVAKGTPAEHARACVYVKERHQPCVCVCVRACAREQLSLDWHPAHSWPCSSGRAPVLQPSPAPGTEPEQGSMGTTSPGPMALEVGTHSSLLLLIWGADPLLPLTKHRAAGGTRHGQRDAPVHTFWSRLQALTLSAEREQPGPTSPWQLDHGPSLASRLPGPQTSVLTKITLSSSPVGTRIPESTRRPGRSLGVR